MAAGGFASVSSITVGTRVYVFKVGSDGSVYVSDATDPSNGTEAQWTAWTDLGGANITSISAVVADGVSLQVFACNSTGVYQSVLLNSGWPALAPMTSGYADLPVEVAAVADANSTTEYVFELGANGNVAVDTYNGSGWSWTSLGGNYTSISAVMVDLQNPQLLASNATEVDQFTIGTNG
ncbi:MAG TPA: hypothetical protein VFF52_25930, partial [Isosphaeraceae bacterium]|nr:hypothetical protein [Isosphaeraceae bacterium]